MGIFHLWSRGLGQRRFAIQSGPRPLLQQGLVGGAWSLCGFQRKARRSFCATTSCGSCLHLGVSQRCVRLSSICLILQANCDLERKVIYTFNARWANEFYKGRVILAGDALHLMPPFIGQGLNSGFRDAGALSWRLPLILRGIADPQAMLQSYQEERLSHVQQLTAR